MRLSQQELLRKAKDEFDVTWDELAKLLGIAPRAMKAYILPNSSKQFRQMNKFAYSAVENVLQEHIWTGRKMVSEKLSK